MTEMLIKRFSLYQFTFPNFNRAVKIRPHVWKKRTFIYQQISQRMIEGFSKMQGFVRTT